MMNPKSPTEYLNEFITELLSLMTNNITIEGKTYNIKILSFVCDTPVRALIKCVKFHVAFYAFYANGVKINAYMRELHVQNAISNRLKRVDNLSIILIMKSLLY